MEMSFGKLIEAFGEHPNPRPPHKVLHPWHKIRENFEKEIHNGENNGAPEYPPELKLLPDGLIPELKENKTITSSFDTKKQYCYLWVINENKIIEILWENTPNEQDVTDKLVKHSNITSGGLAYNGGEIYFASDNRIFINNSSDRYGKRPQYWDGVVNEFKRVYHKYTIIDLENNEEI